MLVGCGGRNPPARALINYFPEPPLTPLQAVQELMGGVPLLRVLCTGQGAGGGGLALLCGPWAALQYTIANADVISFGASWVRWGAWGRLAACCIAGCIAPC